MKKIVILLFLLVSGSSLNAQDLMTKKGLPILPEAGDWSIGFDAIPLLEFVGSIFTDSLHSPSASFKEGYPLTLTGMYVVSPTMAYRGIVRLGFANDKTTTYVPRSGSTNANETVADEIKKSSANVTIGAGLQKWKGKGRLKGFYGAEAFINFNSGKNTYTYGNALSNETPTQNRVKTEKAGTGFGLGIQGFLGVEYFFSAKMSLSAQYGWGPTLSFVGKDEVQTESWNGAGVDSNIINTGKSSQVGFDNNNGSGAINLNFYF